MRIRLSLYNNILSKCSLCFTITTYLLHEILIESAVATENQKYLQCLHKSLLEIYGNYIISHAYKQLVMFPTSAWDNSDHACTHDNQVMHMHDCAVHDSNRLPICKAGLVEHVCTRPTGGVPDIYVHVPYGW